MYSSDAPYNPPRFWQTKKSFHHHQGKDVHRHCSCLPLRHHLFNYPRNREVGSGSSFARHSFPVCEHACIGVRVCFPCPLLSPPVIFVYLVQSSCNRICSQLFTKCLQPFLSDVHLFQLLFNCKCIIIIVTFERIFVVDF